MAARSQSLPDLYLYRGAVTRQRDPSLYTTSTSRGAVTRQRDPSLYTARFIERNSLTFTKRTTSRCPQKSTQSYAYLLGTSI